MDNNTLSKTAVIGADSFIGRYALMRFREAFHNCLGSTHRKNDSLAFLDLEKPDISHLHLGNLNYRYALLCAAITGVDKCELHPDYSYTINVTGTLELIRQLADEGIVPIYLSSDYVFDGKSGNYTEESNLCPVNRYGEHKAAVEKAIPEICGSKYVILRLSKMYSIDINNKSFLTVMIDDMISGNKIRSAYDQIFCPAAIEDLFCAIQKIQARRLYGLFNICPLQSISRYDLSKQIANYLNVPEDNIIRISIDDLDEPFSRPHNTSMNSGKITSLTGVSFASINDCIPLLLHNRSTENGKH